LKYVEGSKRVFLETGTRFPRQMIWAAGAVKYAAAKANLELGLLDRETAEQVMAASKKVMDGQEDGKFVVDVYQTGSGTGLNMNANEVIAGLAEKALGRSVHPNDQVNMSQSSNDVGPTVVRVAAVMTAGTLLQPELDATAASLSRLANRTQKVFKAGRTHLRDALPVTMGQEFGAYSDALARDSGLLGETLKLCLDLPIGGTAVGTGLNAHPRFGALVAAEVTRLSKIKFASAENKFRATKLLSDVAAVSAVIRIAALDLYRLCQDLRLMFSGPITGLGEIDISTQEEVAGSSIMPGKTNPVTVESAVLACAEVVGLDGANQFAAGLGEFELAMGVPLMGYNVVLQMRLLAEGLRKMRTLVLDHVVPNMERTRRSAESSPALITVISPRIGYDRAAKVGKRLAKGESIRAALRGLGYSDSEVRRILDMNSLVRPGIPAKKLKK
jgi:fumarate hydratase, class II